eukprot:359547-Chlamydomonas_euryale.AAC.4
MVMAEGAGEEARASSAADTIMGVGGEVREEHASHMCDSCVPQWALGGSRADARAVGFGTEGSVERSAWCSGREGGGIRGTPVLPAPFSDPPPKKSFPTQLSICNMNRQSMPAPSQAPLQ